MDDHDWNITTKSFNLAEPTWAEITVVVRRARSRSAPGPSGLGYTVFTKCPKLLKRLYYIIKIIC